MAIAPAASAGDAAADLRPNLGEALRLHQAGNVVQAAEIYQRILAAAPDHAEAMHYLGFAASDLGQTDNAIKLTARSIELRPDVAFFHNNFGKILKKAGRLEAAADAYGQAVKIDPKLAEAWNNLGRILADQGKIDDAIAAVKRAIKVQSNFAEAHNNLGSIYFTGRNYREAEKLFRRAIEVRPAYPEAHNNLGASLNALNRVNEAEAAHRKAVELQPDYPVAHGNLGGVLSKLGRLDDALESYRMSLDQDASAVGVHSNLILTMGLDCRFSPDEFLTECRLWNQRHALPRAGSMRPHQNDRDPDRRLRIGYVSGDFRDHAVSHFIEPLFAAHDRDNVELFAYSHVAVPDETTNRIRESMDRWCDTVDMTHSGLADQIRADGIDILIDLAGHTESNRLLVFAEKPAPVQATWLGYGGTTGMDAMDYRISDAVTDPEGLAEAQHSETLIRLPGGFLCYAPPADAPEISPSPGVESGDVTFASFNDLSKVTPQTMRLWARVLHAVPGARMMVKGRLFAEVENQQHYLDIFKEAGIGEDRIELLAHFPTRQAYMEIYKKADIVLDTFPYNGGTTTCEALWMGLPVVTLCGDRTVSRMSASILTRVGAENLVAKTDDEYVGIAVGLAGDPARLKDERVGWRRRMQASPLCDGPAFARAMEAAYRDMWRKWCAG